MSQTLVNININKKNVECKNYECICIKNNGNTQNMSFWDFSMMTDTKNKKYLKLEETKDEIIWLAYPISSGNEKNFIMSKVTGIDIFGTCYIYRQSPVTKKILNITNDLYKEIILAVYDKKMEDSINSSQTETIANDE
jgi:hypothetical protein